jgi:hypothetical protein
MPKTSSVAFAGLLAVVVLLRGCENGAASRHTSMPSPSSSFSPGVTVSADRSEDFLRIVAERARIAAEQAAAVAQQLADELAAEEARRAAEELLSQPDDSEPISGAYSRDDVAGTIQSLTGLPVAVVFDATWCDANSFECGGVFTRAPRAPSTVEELTMHMSDSPAWLYAQVGYRVAVHEAGHVLTAYYQPQILAAFGPAFLDTNIEKIADCYLIMHVGGTTGTSG